MANDPPFATLNQFAGDSGIPGESANQRIGISGIAASQQMALAEASTLKADIDKNVGALEKLTTKIADQRKLLHELTDASTADYTSIVSPPTAPSDEPKAVLQKQETVIVRGVAPEQGADVAPDAAVGISVISIRLSPEDQQILDDLLQRWAKAPVPVQKVFVGSILKGIQEIDQILLHLEAEAAT